MQKIYTFTASLIFTALMSASAFAQIGQAKTLVIYNDTGYPLASTLAPNYNPLHFPKTVAKDANLTLHYHHLQKAEFIRLEPIINGSHIVSNMLINVDNDGIRGDATTHLSYRWANLPWISLLTICTKATASQCPFSV